MPDRNLVYTAPCYHAGQVAYRPASATVSHQYGRISGILQGRFAIISVRILLGISHRACENYLGLFRKLSAREDPCEAAHNSVHAAKILCTDISTVLFFFLTYRRPCAYLSHAFVVFFFLSWVWAKCGFRVVLLLPRIAARAAAAGHETMSHQGEISQIFACLRQVV
jgi:hypothetical protein